jgi:hydrogenase nickel incorporation protein HypA/HybF
MHELAVAEDLLATVLAEAQKVEAKRVTAVSVSVGELSGVAAESLAFYWELLVPGTAAEGAKLRLTSQPAWAICSACGRAFRPEARSFVCPYCGSLASQLAEGEALILEAIECE